MSTTRISFVRHGEVHNPKQIYYGRLPRFRLSDNGRLQALNTAKILQNEDITAVYSSPMLRARQTAGIIANLLQRTVHISSYLNEAHTPYDGQLKAIMVTKNWDFYTGSPPEYEQPEDIVQRTAHFAHIVRRRHPGHHIVAVSHADPIAYTALWAVDRPMSLDWRKNLTRIGLAENYPNHASILTLTFNEVGERPCQIHYQSPNGS